MMSFSQCICWLYVISFIQWKWRFLCNLSFQTARYFWHLTKYFTKEGFPQCWCGSSVKQSRLHHSHVQFCLNLKITFLVLYFAGVNLIFIHITPRPVLKIFFFFFYSEINLNINQNSWSKFVHTMLYNIFLCFKFLGLVMKILPLWTISY